MRRRPYLNAAIAFVVRGAILRLEIDVSQERISVSGFHHLVRVSECVIGIAVAAHDRLRFLPRQMRSVPLELGGALSGC